MRKGDTYLVMNTFLLSRAIVHRRKNNMYMYTSFIIVLMGDISVTENTSIR